MLYKWDVMCVTVRYLQLAQELFVHSCRKKGSFLKVQKAKEKISLQPFILTNLHILFLPFPQIILSLLFQTFLTYIALTTLLKQLCKEGHHTFHNESDLDSVIKTKTSTLAF